MSNVVRLPVKIDKVRIAREFYRALTMYAVSYAEMGEIIGDMMKYQTQDQFMKDVTLLMVMLHRDGTEWREMHPTTC